jgi:UDP-N-acetylmuramoylalanine--D-glutamate ligase
MLLDELRARGGEVAVIGLGRSGVAATLLLRDRGIPVYASDLATGHEAAGWRATLEAAGASVDLGRHDLARVARAEAAIVAPGVPPGVPPLRAAHEHGVPVYAEVDLGYTALPDARFVGITGTNGKTTTTSLVAHVLAGLGLDVVAAGNIGLPLCDVARAPSGPAWVALELSSFQLHDCPHVAPTIGVLLNLAPNHLDRYPSLEAYYADKALLFRNAGPQSVTISNADDEAVQRMVAPVPGQHLRFSVQRSADAWYDREAGWLMLGSERLLERLRLPLLGHHNVANALTAALVARAALALEQGAPAGDRRLVEALTSFRAIAHRVEPVREVDGVLWINDSKSTNITSTEVAIAAQDRPFVLLLGGRHKGEPYTRLRGPLAGRARAVIAYGEAGDMVARDLAGSAPVVRAESFEDVVRKAQALAHPGDAVLLSPACSSYDMFRNYEERGTRFRQLVEQLAGHRSTTIGQ